MPESQTKDAKLDLVVGGIWLLGIVMVVYMIAIPFYILFGAGGAEDAINITKFTIYPIIGTSVALFFMLGVKVPRLALSKKTKEWYDVYVHDPEKGVFAKLKSYPVGSWLYRTNKHIILLWLFGILLFSPVMVLRGFKQQTAVESTFLHNWFPQTGFPGASYFTEQQVTPSAAVGFSVTPASPAETLLLCFIVAVSLMLFKWLAVSGVIPAVAASIAKWTVVPLIGASGHLLEHLVRYGGQDVALQSVFTFGLLSSYLYLLFASIVVPLVFHDLTNLILKLFEKGFLGSDQSFGVYLTIWFATLILYVGIYMLFKKYDRVLGVTTV